MKKFKRIMIGLDFTLIDQTLIQYAAFLSYYLDPEKIYFVNIQSDLDMPDTIRQSFPELNQPRDEKLREEMQERIDRWFPNHADYAVDLQIIEGSPRRELARWAHIKNIDLLLVGKKDLQHGKGIIPQQLARKLGCALLFVPEKIQFRLGEILVANDFSDYAKSAMEAALKFVEVDPSIQIFSGHVFCLPQGYSRTGKSEEEFASIMESHARERYEVFMNGFANTEKVKPRFIFDATHKTAARVLYETALQSDIDLIIIGSRGHNAATAFLLGSVSEKLIRISESCPVLVMKHPTTIGIQSVVEAL